MQTTAEFFGHSSPLLLLLAPFPFTKALSPLSISFYFVLYIATGSACVPVDFISWGVLQGTPFSNVTQVYPLYVVSFCDEGPQGIISHRTAGVSASFV